MNTIKSENMQYIKSLGNGLHLLYDFETDTLEIWMNSKNTSSNAIKWNNTALEFVRQYEDQRFSFDAKLNEKVILDNLSHGSGIDCKWAIEDKDKYFKCSNSFHCMNSNGYYCGHADFTLIISKKNPLEFSLHFIDKYGSNSQYLNKKHMLRDYLEELFHYDIQSMLSDLLFIGERV